ncbi:hypothetical protein RA269_28015, partial [Pseudomonas syringae pv. tagetis]|uniref:hypothetical protein n=1 Tax=Pseudomonas syringae group genomosp. 7 TaxID=251699 RepID=UPI00377057BB
MGLLGGCGCCWCLGVSWLWCSVGWLWGWVMSGWGCAWMYGLCWGWFLLGGGCWGGFLWVLGVGVWFVLGGLGVVLG